MKPVWAPDSQWSTAHTAGRCVRVDTLAKGRRFRCIQGQEWTYERLDGALTGVHHARRSDGFTSAFAGCAEVLPAGAGS